MRDSAKNRALARMVLQHAIDSGGILSSYIQSLRVFPDDFAPKEDEDILEGEVVSKETVHPDRKRLGDGA